MAQYVITAQEIIRKVNNKNTIGNTVYYAIDQSSGGYPYWSSYIGHAKFFDNEPDFLKEVGSCLDRMCSNISCVSIDIIDLVSIKMIETKSVDEIKKKKEIDEIQSQIDELQKKLKEVKSS